MIKLIIIVIILFSGCSLDENTRLIDDQNVTVQLMKTAGIKVASAICHVSAQDMDTITVDLTVTETLISGVIPAVPFGTNRKFEISCYDNDQVLNYYGYTITDIGSYAPIIDIMLYPTQTHTDVIINGRFSSIPPTDEKIVFSADWSGSYDIYIMDVNGTNIRKITSSSYKDCYPRLSPDRNKIIFNRITSDDFFGFIVDVNTLELEQLDLEGYNPLYFFWHPDGKNVLFKSFKDNNHVIYTYNLENKALVELINNGAINRAPAYSSDGQMLLYQSDISGLFKLYIANADGSNSARLIPNGLGEEKVPRMHPKNSNQILFYGRYYSPTSNVQWGIFLYDRQDEVIHDIVSSYGVNEQWPDWSPDGEKIVFQRFDGGSNGYGLYIVNPDGSDYKVLIDTPGNEQTPHWR